MLYFLLFLAIPLLLPLYFLIIFWNWIVLSRLGYWGISASVESNGIRLSNRAKTINRLLLWQDISEVGQVFQPPIFNLVALLRSGESFPIHFQVDSNTNIELALEEHNIPFIKRDKGFYEDNINII